MPINGFSVGRDVSLDVVTASGPLNFGLITKFSSKQSSKEEQIKGLDGITRPVRFFDGWSGSFSIERQDSLLDDFFAAAARAGYAENTPAHSAFTPEPAGEDS